MINSLEEAIKHCEKVAEKKEKECKWISGSEDAGMNGALAKTFAECASEHRQLAEWLRELKAYKKAYTEIDSKIESDYMGNNEYEMAVSDGYQSAINIIDRCIEEVNVDD